MNKSGATNKIFDFVGLYCPDKMPFLRRKDIMTLLE